jgi:hypothetical protein
MARPREQAQIGALLKEIDQLLSMLEKAEAEIERLKAGIKEWSVLLAEQGYGGVADGLNELLRGGDDDKGHDGGLG